MKKILIILVLLFTSSVVADDISDFQIEGMSLGDSLLDYLSEQEIRNNIYDVYDYIEDKTFIMAGFDKELKSLKTYEFIQITFKDKDKKYRIHGITGKLFSNYNTDIHACYKKQDEIVKEISLIEDIQTTYGPEIRKHPADTSGKSTGRQTTLVLKSGIAIAVECYYWHDNMYHNNLRVSLHTDELDDWLY